MVLEKIEFFELLLHLLLLSHLLYPTFLLLHTYYLLLLSIFQILLSALLVVTGFFTDRCLVGTWGKDLWGFAGWNGRFWYQVRVCGLALELLWRLLVFQHCLSNRILLLNQKWLALYKALRRLFDRCRWYCRCFPRNLFRANWRLLLAFLADYSYHVPKWCFVLLFLWCLRCFKGRSCCGISRYYFSLLLMNELWLYWRSLVINGRLLLEILLLRQNERSRIARLFCGLLSLSKLGFVSGRSYIVNKKFFLEVISLCHITHRLNPKYNIIITVMHFKA